MPEVFNKKMKKLLTRNEFNDMVFKRDQNRCILCPSTSNLVVHHIIERKLWSDGGYYKENGITVCPVCHIQVEAGFILPHKLWEIIGVNVREAPLPWGFDANALYDKWGAKILYEGLDGSFIVCPNEFKKKFEKAVRIAGGFVREVSPEWLLDVMGIECEINGLNVTKLKPL